MIDYINIFSELRLKISEFMNSDSTNKQKVYERLRETVNRYFSKSTISNINFELRNNNTNEWTAFTQWAGNWRSILHIYYWNLLDELKSTTLVYLTLKNSQTLNDVIKDHHDTELTKMNKVIKSEEMKKNVNERLSKYYRQEESSYKNYTGWIKYVYYIFLLVIFILFFVKKQYKNLKILFFILMLFLITYAIEPIFNLISRKTYHINRILQLSISYLFLIILFGLFISFKNFVFTEPNEQEGKRDSKILAGITIFGLICLLWRYLYYDKGIKSFTT